MKLTTYLYAVITMVLLSIIIFTPAYIFLNDQTKQKISQHFNNQLKQTSIELEAVKNTYTLVANSVFDNSINNEEILSLIKRANAQDEAGKALLRQELYTKLLPLYKNLNKQNIPQLHFHLKNSVSFLRFHRPEKFGDSLVGARYSINKVNRTFQPEHGFEEGYLFNGFRHVYPLIYNNKFAGTVEISYAYNTLRAELMNLSRASYNFIILKEVVSSKARKNVLNYYEKSVLSEKYLHDLGTLKQPKNSNFTKDELQDINGKIASKTSQQLSSQREFLIETQLNEKDVLVMFFPILNVENNQIAYFISYSYDGVLAVINKTHKIEMLVSLIIAIIISILFVLYVLSQKRATRALELLATTDPLTNIANRNKVNIILDKAIHMAQRYKLPLSVIIFDIDNFKKINDKNGQESGDTVLSTISTLISHYVRQSDTFARWGGDQFIIVLPETEHKNAHMLAERFRKVIDQYKFLPNVKVTCSFGVTQLHDDEDESSLLKRLDDALSSAKENGKNKVIELA